MSKTNKKAFEETCAVFIKTVNNYFSKLTNTPSKTGIPYLKDQNTLLAKDYTGMIGISGNRKGYVYISGSEYLYAELTKKFIGLDNPQKEDIMDMAGEVSNVIAGNLRETYGSNFAISVPIVFEGKPDRQQLDSNNLAYVIPISWQGHEANVVIQID